MALSKNAKHVLDLAQGAEDISSLVVIGEGKDGKIQLFIGECNREKLIVLLERAKSQLVRSLE